MQDTELPEKIEPTTPNFQTELAAKIAEIVPESLSDGRLDVAKLRELINGDAETSQEKFGLFWPGKRAAQALAQIPTTATLVPASEESEDWENTKNLFIEGDNLEVLKALQNSYRRKVKMIYIDPPYNTGKEFIYPDKFSEGLQGYLDYTGQKNEAGENTESKQETGGRKHSGWLSMMYPRLQLAKSLLADDGVIFISIGEDENSNLKKICEEVFGEANYIGQVITVSNPRGSQEPFGISSVHEYVLCFGRTAQSKESIMGLPREDEAEFNFTTRDGKKARLLGLRKRGGDWKRSDRPNMYYPFYVNPQTKEVRVAPDSSFTEEVLPKRPSGEESRWTWGKSTASERSGELVAKEIKRGDKTEYDIYRLDLFETESGTAKLQKLKSLWDEKELNYQNARGIFKDLFGNSEVFDFPKPIEMIMKMMRSLNDKDCIVVDFFSGSGTTGHAVMQLNLEDGGNRTHIQVQLPEPTFTVNKNNEEVPTKAGAVAFNLGFRSISQVAIERIRRAGIKIREANAELIAKRSTPFDTGFRVYRLAPSNFVQWDESEAKDNIQQAVLDFAANKKPDAAPESLLAEIMLQSRIQLDARIEKRDLQTSGWVYIVDGGNLIAYVADEQITEAQVNEIAELAPAKLVILDSAFNGNNALKINVMNICKEKFIKEFKTI